jgi:uncharacterized protein YecE (DUF72 family)
VKSKRSNVEQGSLFEMDRPEGAVSGPSRPNIGRPFDHPQLLLGTSAFTASGWAGSFYPVGMKSDDYLTHYASKFRTVEIDSTYYGTPAASTVESWYRKTPADFIFAAKVPQVVTHTNMLLNCEAEFDEFILRMSLLKEKLGPLLFQFPHFSKYEFKGPGPLFSRLRVFLKRATEAYKCRFAVEIRNRTWVDARLTDLLREYKVALALADTSFIPRPWEYKDKLNIVTADFTYVRWLGDRKGIEEMTRTWDKIIVDRRDDLMKWAEVFRQFSDNIHVYTYANNHYAGNGPQTISLFWKLLTESGRTGG